MAKPRYSLAVGVEYRENQTDAPTVVVKGEADLADKVVQLAHRYGIPIIEDGNLAVAMQSLPLDEEIPEDLYRAVAVVLNQVESCMMTRGRTS